MKDRHIIVLPNGVIESIINKRSYNTWLSEKTTEEAEEPQYDGLRAEVKERYEKLKADMSTLTVLQAKRLFQYLQGQSREEIAQSASPPVSRDTIYTTIIRICKKWGWSNEQLNQARTVWEYGQAYLE